MNRSYRERISRYTLLVKYLQYRRSRAPLHRGELGPLSETGFSELPGGKSARLALIIINCLGKSELSPRFHLSLQLGHLCR